MVGIVPYKSIIAKREYQRNWMANRRATWILEHGPCVGCGSWCGLQVHHRDPDQKVSHKIWSWRKERRDVELAKCEARCLDCHLEEHEIHGTGHYTTRTRAQERRAS